jgi:hypothetical protein
VTRGWGAVAGVPVATILLLGAAMGDIPPTSPTSMAGAPVAFPADMPAPAVPFTGTSTGCTISDPTGTGGCLTPATAWMLAQVTTAFGPLPGSCWDAHAWNPASDHPHGRACDFTFGSLGAFPDTADAERGWVLAHWLELNADALDVEYLIWDGRIWSAGRALDGWRPYTGGGVYDPTDPTGGHYDHIHVSIDESGRS